MSKTIATTLAVAVVSLLTAGSIATTASAMSTEAAVQAVKAKQVENRAKLYGSAQVRAAVAAVKVKQEQNRAKLAEIMKHPVNKYALAARAHKMHNGVDGTVDGIHDIQSAESAQIQKHMKAAEKKGMTLKAYIHQQAGNDIDG